MFGGNVVSLRACIRLPLFHICSVGKSNELSFITVVAFSSSNYFSFAKRAFATIFPKKNNSRDCPFEG
jgi:hypothetical protein